VKPSAAASHIAADLLLCRNLPQSGISILIVANTAKANIKYYENISRTDENILS
jgi:hypothetical protein